MVDKILISRIYILVFYNHLDTLEFIFLKYGQLFVLTFFKFKILDFISLDDLKSHFSLFSFIKNFADSA